MLEGFAIQLTNVSNNWKLNKIGRNIVPAFNSGKQTLAKCTTIKDGFFKTRQWWNMTQYFQEMF